METTQNTPIGTPPENYLVWAILSTIFCCLPLGIVSIVKSTKVKELWAQGDTQGALQASKEAKKWAIYAAIAQVIVYVILIILSVLGFFGALIGNGAY